MKKSTIIILVIIGLGSLMYLFYVLQKGNENQISKSVQLNTNEVSNEVNLPIEQEMSNQTTTSIPDITGQISESVLISNFAFSPANLVVKKGTTVTWINQDNVGHTVTVDISTGLLAQAGPDSSLFGQGQSYSYTLNEVGTYAYHCKPHPNMRASVSVIE
ncbi:MAG: Blue (Type 1) copper domain protein [Candidatus Nomurabacteria bacterium GW2011_GWB1_37_5]|uniref:Blue (Type 1) copper domain protein n=1 Tax=Candidatus Nomurabacteria bacterium GW2011_GWB1_37_5 TaxID=1618742 RepID=A0A0G0H8A7_9BACT|nr:MAG: Blue (Type 1) copper domain protein [Candidatus Nomurabacteria bacterium GW2011_GWB1_37_5]